MISNEYQRVLTLLTFLLCLSLLLASPPTLPAAESGVTAVSASGSGRDGTDDRDDDRDDDDHDDDDDRDDDDRDDDDRDDDRSGSSNSGSSDDSGSSSSSGSAGGSSSSNSSSSSDSSSSTASDDNPSRSDDDNSSGGSSSNTTSTTASSSRERLEGKSKAVVNGFRAELSVRLETRFDRVKFRAEASNLNFDAGTSLLVCHGGNALGDIVLNSFRFGELELDSRLGHSIPLSGGERIELYRGPCGSELLLAANLGGGATPSGGISSTAPGAGGSSTAPSATSTQIEGKTRRLINGFEAELNIRFERRPDRDKFRGEAENLNLGQGTRLELCYNGGLLGDLTLNAFNFGELELDSRLGHNVPVFQSGDVIELRQGGCGGALILSATFGGSTVTGGGNSSNNGGGAPASTTRVEIEGKTRRPINGFEAELSVRFEQRFDRDKIRAEVSNLNLTVGRQLTVCYGGMALGNLVLNSLHFAELELDSRLGHNVPVLSIGDSVELSPGACGVTPLMTVRMQTAD